MLNFLTAAQNGSNDGQLMLVVTLTGILIVFAALLLLTFIIKIYGKLISGVAGKERNKAAEPAKKSVSAPAPAPVVKAAQQDVQDDTIIAVIAAAVAAFGMSEGKTYKVRSVRKSAPVSGRSAWANAGVIENTRPF